MNVTKPIPIREIILRGDWPKEWIEEFKDAKVVNSMLDIKASNGMGLRIRDEEDGLATTVNLEP